jgi:hypothetical protein
VLNILLVTALVDEEFLAMEAYSIFKPREGVKKQTKRNLSTNQEQMACFAFMVWKTLPNSWKSATISLQ